jgi:asparaginyl-tRNA synthetase
MIFIFFFGMGIKEQYKVFTSDKIKVVLKIQSEIRRGLGSYLVGKDFIEISPVIISLITDPLHHPTKKSEIEYEGKKFKLTQSMIFHKQIAILTHKKIFAFSPNIRLEPIEFLDTHRHLIEFTQLDLEVRGAKRSEVISLAEELLIGVIASVKASCKKELGLLKRRLELPNSPFERISYKKAYEQYGPDFESVLSYFHKEPFWIVDFPINAREFYDKEDPTRPGILLDMDLIYPEGHGEALSGGEREHEYNRVISRMKLGGLDPASLKPYLEFLKEGLPPSAGFGIGIERLTRWICGLSSIEETSLFPKLPGGGGF